MNHERLVSLRKFDNDAAEGMGSIMEAALGLTSLGAPSSSAPPPKESVAVAPSKSAFFPPAAVAVEQPEPVMETTPAPTEKRQRPTFPPARAAGATTQPNPPPSCHYHGQLPLSIRRNECGAVGVPYLPPSRGINMVQSQSQHLTLAHLATTVHRPTPYPHRPFPQCQYPDPPHPSSNSQLPSGVIKDNLVLRQKVNQRSWTTSWEQLPPRLQMRTQSQQGYTTETDAIATTTTTRPAPHAPTSVTLNFPEVLYKILSSPSKQHILSWLPHGRGFVIHDKQLFASQILLPHFDGAKYTSFTRRLKRWKFERVQHGPEIGAYYNKYFTRDRPDLARGIMYVMDDGGNEIKEADEQLNVKSDKNKQMKEEEKKIEKDRKSGVASLDDDAAYEDAAATAVMGLHRQQQPQLNHTIDETMMNNDEGQGDQGEKKREQKKKKKKNNPEAVASFGFAYDNAVVEVAMEFHRQKPKQKQQQIFLESESIHREKKWKQQQTLPPSSKASSSSERLPTPYDSNDYSIPELSTANHLNDIQVSEQQSKISQWPSSNDSLRQKTKKPRDQNPPEGKLYTSQPGYEESTKPQRKRKQTQKEQHPLQQQSWQPQPPLGQGNSYPERQQKLGPELGATSYNPEGYLSMSMAHPNVAEVSMAKLSMPHHNNRNPNAFSLDRDVMLSQKYLSIVTLPENDQQQCLNNIGRHVLSDMPYPTLLTVSSSDSLSTNKYSSSNSNDKMDDRINFNINVVNDRVNDAMSDPGMVRDTAPIKSQFRDTLSMNNHRFLTNQDMMQKMLTSSNTHKQIMMMAARDLQSRASGGGQLAGTPQPQHQLLLQMQQSQLSREYLSMKYQQQQLLQRTLP